MTILWYDFATSFKIQLFRGYDFKSSSGYATVIENLSAMLRGMMCLCYTSQSR